MFRHYSYHEPPSKREKETPLVLVMSNPSTSGYSSKATCTTDLIIIVLFFCLRSCEYSKMNSHHRTKKLRLRDMYFHDQRSGHLGWWSRPNLPCRKYHHYLSGYSEELRAGRVPNYGIHGSRARRHGHSRCAPLHLPTIQQLFTKYTHLFILHKT